jgi:hypothetical protein
LKREMKNGENRKRQEFNMSAVRGNPISRLHFFTAAL